ncbi:MAG: hypothetical protein SGARI_004803, partial [Bacillariaceae sp.]
MLLKWTTDFVVPALLETQDDDSMLRDLDLSHISVSDSSVHGPPGSPSLMSPPRQKPNVGRTPVAMRSQTSTRSERDLPVTLSEKIAGSLLMSSCMIASEMLAMGVLDADEIGKASQEWCVVLEQSNSPWHETFFPSFVRLAVQLNRASRESSLLENLLVLCDNCDDDASSGYKPVKSALKSVRGDEETFVRLFLKVIDGLVQGNEKWQPSLETASCLTDVWDKGGTIGIFMELIETLPSLQQWVAKGLAESLASSDGNVTPVVAFQAKCLSALSMVVESNTMSEILRGVDTERVGDDDSDDVREF